MDQNSQPITPQMIGKDMRYLQLLSGSFSTIASASTEIINLEAINNLPKGTEHFISDMKPLFMYSKMHLEILSVR